MGVTMFKYLREFISTILGRLGKWLIPDHVKRILFLITVYHYLIDDLDNQNQDQLDELSLALKLTKTSPAALILPGFFTTRIWTQSIIDRLVKIQPMVNDRRTLMLIPCWLQYGRASEIAQDIVKLRQYVSAFKPA